MTVMFIYIITPPLKGLETQGLFFYQFLLLHLLNENTNYNTIIFNCCF